MASYKIPMTHQLLLNRTTTTPDSKEEQNAVDTDYPASAKIQPDNVKDEDIDIDVARGRSIHRHDHSQPRPKTNGNTCTSISPYSRSRSAVIPRQSSRRPRREAGLSISPIRAVYNHAERGDVYLYDAYCHIPGFQPRARSGRSAARISPGAWYDRSAHLRYGLAHETRTERCKSPDWDDEGDEDAVAKRMVEARSKRTRRKDKRLVRSWVGENQEGVGRARESAEEAAAWDTRAEACGESRTS